MTNPGNRIVDPLNVVLPDRHVLLEIFKKKSSIIITSESDLNPFREEEIDYIQVVAIGAGVTRCEVGDIIMDLEKFQQVSWETRGRYFIKVPEENIRLAVHKENFQFKEEVDSLNIN